jgi:two-component system response regulator PilR (NtrC family)
VRELENILERARRALCFQAQIDVAGPAAACARRSRGLPRRPATHRASPYHGEVAGSAPGGRSALASAASVGTSAAALGDQLELMEREAIIRALEQTRYNKTAAARLLGMSFRALRYRVKKLGIE